MAAFNDDKDLEISHIELPGTVDVGCDSNKLGGDEHVVDTLAADYIDPTVVISPAENKRLRRKAFR